MCNVLTVYSDRGKFVSFYYFVVKKLDDSCSLVMLRRPKLCDSA